MSNILFLDTMETLNGWTYSLSAEVGLLSKNVRVIGGEYTDMQEESFGARVLVGMTTKLEGEEVIVRQGYISSPRI